MDKLKNEILKKRKVQNEVQESKNNKYLKKSDFINSDNDNDSNNGNNDNNHIDFDDNNQHISNNEHINDGRDVNNVDDDSKDFVVSNEDCIHRLRLKGEPITLFGESDRERRLRLRALELLSSDNKSEGQGQQNDLRKALEGLSQAEMESKNSLNSNQNVGRNYSESELKVTWQMINVDKDKLFATIYKYLKSMLALWEYTLSQRPEQVRKSKQGQLAAANQVQTAGYLKPLFKILRNKSLDRDVLTLLGEIILHAQSKHYQDANDAYLRLSIGNAPWPIGVTMVGIHDRSAREKISSSQVAHVLNDEVSRKYIQSVKRVLTFVQSQYPPEDVSQMVG